MLHRFWGDHYFDLSSKKWTTNSEASDGSKLNRSFVKFIMDPIARLGRLAIEGDKQGVSNILDKIEVSLKKHELE